MKRGEALTPSAPLSHSSGEGRTRGCASPALDVLSVGNFCVDMLVKPVRQLPPPGGLEIIEEYELQTGGCSNNCAIALARLGLSVATVGRVGQDRTGDIVLDLLARNGVCTDLMVRDPSASTSLSVVVINERGERSFIHHPGATQNLSLDDVLQAGRAFLGPEPAATLRALHVGGAFLLPSLDGEPMAQLLRQAQEAGALTFVDTAVDGKGNRLGVVDPILPYLDYFLPSEAEALGITGLEEPEEMAAFLLGRGVRTVCIKLGERGSYVAGELESPHPPTPSPIGMGEGEASRGSGDRRSPSPAIAGEGAGGEGVLVPAFAVTPVDTCGAGDTFTAGFIAGILNGFGAVGAARLANAVGAMCVTGLGATTAIGTWEETLAFMERTPVRETAT
ncbi:MAG: carbohydrate kinase family protein [Anaerolineae bacterium]